MLRRLRLPGKLVVAALPLLATLLAVSTFLVQGSLEEAAEERNTARLAAGWEPLNGVLAALGGERDATLEKIGGGAADVGAARKATDARVSSLESHLGSAGSPRSLMRQVEAARLGITAVRAFHDESGTSAATQAVRIPEGYAAAEELLLEIGDLFPAEVPNQLFARDLAAVSALGAALEAADAQEHAILVRLHDSRAFGATAEVVRSARQDLEERLSSFQAVANEQWAARYRSDAFPAVQQVGAEIDRFIESPIALFTKSNEQWEAEFAARDEALTSLQSALTESVIAEASAAAAAAQQRAWIIAGAVGAGVLVAALVTFLVARSVVGRIRSLTDRARHVAQEQLPALVEALRDPGEDVALPAIPPVRDRGADEVGDLARSFAAMQSTLEHVAEQQLDVLRKGVADMFVTLARRNRSLIDRQLSLIDQLESDEDDPTLLSDLYRLDHLATRMRRNAESLLVLAGSESPRTWRRPLEIDDVVRAAIGEVEDYRRVDVLTLESLEVNGSAVADLSHLLSELIENATSFSPPDTRVRIAGHFHEEGYLISISDKGVGVPERRTVELNRLLESPPIVGLALEPTLGLYVVAMLSKRHGIKVRLVPAAPGMTAKILVPPALFEIRSRREPVPAMSPPAAPEPVIPGRRELRMSGVGPGSSAMQPPNGSPGGKGSPRRSGNGRPAALDVPAAPRLRPSGNGRHVESQPGGPSGSDRPGNAGIPPPAPPQGPELRADPPPAAPGAPALPTRVPGTSYRESESAETTSGSERSPHEIRDALGAFETGTRMAAGDRMASDLPTRRPGTSYVEEVSENSGPTVSGGHGPDAIRSALSSYQLGLEVGRRDARPEDDTGGESHE